MKLQELLDVPVQLKDPQSPGTRGLQLRKKRPQRRYFEYMHMVKEDIDYCANCGNLILPEAYKGGLRKWFKDKWVNIAKKKKGGGHPECGTSGDKEGYAKCAPASKARSMTKKQKASAVRRKRSAQRKAGRPGKESGGAGKKPINVKTKKK